MYSMIPFGRMNTSWNDLFDDFERRMFPADRGELPAFRTDIRDEGDHFLLEADLPGMRREDLHVDLAGDYLTISAQRGETRTEEAGDSGSYLRRERSFGRVQRTFDVSEVDTDAITASYRSGVLSLRLPKLHQAEPDVRHVDIQ